MAEYSSFELPFDYTDQDQYIRAIRYHFIRRNGDIKAGAFKSHNGGVSVTRSNDLLLSRALTYMKAHFEGRMAVFPQASCASAEIFEKYSPSPGHNLHHWELFGNRECGELTEEQIDTLIDESVLL